MRRGTRISLAIWSSLVIAFLWIPLVIIALYAFNGSTLQSWPITDWSTHWFSVAWHNADARSALTLSLKVGAIVTAIATFAWPGPSRATTTSATRNSGNASSTSVSRAMTVSTQPR